MAVFRRGASALVALVFTLPALLVDAGLVFTSPESLVGYHSPRCCSMSTHLPSKFEAYNRTLVMDVDTDICGDVTNETIRKYNDSLFWCRDVRFKCQHKLSSFPTMYESHQFATNQVRKHGGAACFLLWGDPNQVKADVWVGAYWFGSGYKGKPKFPYANCQYVEPIPGSGREAMPSFFIDKRIIPEQSSLDVKPQRLRASLVLDDNPFMPLLDHPLWFIYFRGWGVIYLLTALDCARALRERLKIGISDAKIPELMLAIEGVTLTMVGLFNIAYGCWDTDLLPKELGFMILNLMGPSLATSFMAGVYFQDLRNAITKLQMDQGKSFWKKKRLFILFIAALCSSVDIFAGFSTYYGVRGFATLIGLFLFVAQLSCAISFLRDTNSFLKTVMSSITDVTGMRKLDTESKQYLKLIQMAKMLRISGAAMFLITIHMTINVMSGSAFKGFHSPTGFAILSCTGIALRWVPSVAQIQMAKPSSMLKSVNAKKRRIAPSTLGTSNPTSMSVSSSVPTSESSSSSSGSSPSSSSSTGGASCSESVTSRG